MTTKTIGTFFVGKDYPGRKAWDTRVEGDTFTLSLRLIDNQGPRCVEPYVVRWRGPEARAWWHTHGPLKAGDALALELENPRSFQGMRTPEIQANVVRCELLPPRAPAAMTASLRPAERPNPSTQTAQ